VQVKGKNGRRSPSSPVCNLDCRCELGILWKEHLPFTRCLWQPSFQPTGMNLCWGLGYIQVWEKKKQPSQAEAERGGTWLYLCFARGLSYICKTQWFQWASAIIRVNLKIVLLACQRATEKWPTGFQHGVCSLLRFTEAYFPLFFLHWQSFQTIKTLKYLYSI
jgi:hypothetical protein